MDIKISPSILACDFCRLGEEINRACKSGADMLHFDVMDGVFVPNLSFGLPLLKAAKSVSAVPLDVHLMIIRPLDYIEAFAKAGADSITFHAESESDIVKTVEKSRECGVRVGLSLKPATPAEECFPYLDMIDLLLVMTVEPGFGGQSFMMPMLDKIAKIRAEAARRGIDLDIQIDGGVNCETAGLAVQAGANVLVSGSFLFNSGDMSAEISRLKAL